MLMQRSPQGDYVSKGWEGRTVVCIASGPSLTKEQVEIAREFNTIVVNDNYLIAPWADLLYFADYKWWQWHKEGLLRSWSWASFSVSDVRRAFAEFKGQKVSIIHQPMASDKEIFFLKNDGAEGLSENPHAIKTGSNSGYQAVNIAVLSGAKRILLIGYDMSFGEGKRSHSHNGHPQKQSETVYKGYAKRFNTMRPQLEKLGVKVINCTPGSAIDCFEKGTLESFLPDKRPALVS